jgi:glutamyl-tRNA synthetase
MTIRTRFAPSPTGYLHIGGARTALYAWLYARANDGIFILRIEDTDRERSTQDAVDAILEGMAWLNLDYDQGPFYQTKRMERYHDLIDQLLRENKAYRCYCSKERLEKLRTTQLEKKQKPRYDGHCRYQVRNETTEPFVIRFKNPESGEVRFNDQIRGSISVQNEELDDLIIARANGMPTYNFTVVVDDFDMQITHVIRGDDHINNTPRQINIFNALGVKPPCYAHLPMILGSDGKRLSKRHGAVSVLQYRNEGYLPEALINYLVRLGWSYGDQEIFSREAMIQFFTLNHISRSPAIFNPDKLRWLNQHYLKASQASHLAEQLAWHLDRLHLDVSHGPPLTHVVIAQRERAKTLVEVADKSRFLFEDVTDYEKSAVRKEFNKETISIFDALLERLLPLESWNKESLHVIILAVAEQFKLKMGKVAQPLRIAVTGNTISPAIDVTLALLGKKKTIERLHRAIDWITYQLGDL